jgi:hypothetical protein
MLIVEDSTLTVSVVFNNEHNSYQYNESDTAPSLHRLAHSRVFNNEHNSYQYNESDTAPSLHSLAHSSVYCCVVSHVFLHPY